MDAPRLLAHPAPRPTPAAPSASGRRAVLWIANDVCNLRSIDAETSKLRALLLALSSEAAQSANSSD